MSNARTTVTAIGLAAVAGATVAQGPPAVSVPNLPDPIAYPGGNGPSTFLPPGQWPDTVTAKNWELEFFGPTPSLGNSDNFRLIGAGGPLLWTATRTGRADIDTVFGVAEPANPLSNIGDPFWDGFREPNGSISLDNGGLPTYGWAPHAAKGVAIVEIIQNGQDIGAVVEIAPGITVPVGDVYSHAGAVANGAERTGRAYDMVTGEWDNLGVIGDISNNQFGISSSMWFWTTAVGSAQGESAADFASAWFPYEQGWLGGYPTAKGLEINDVPTGWDFAPFSEYLVETVTATTINETEVLPFGSDLGADASFDPLDPEADWELFGAHVQGSFTPDQTGDWAIGVQVDDNSRLEILIDGQWRTLSVRRGTGGCTDVYNVVSLDAGVSYDIRGWWGQDTGGACFTINASPAVDTDNNDQIDPPTDLLVFDAPGATVDLYNFRLYAPKRTSIDSGYYDFYAGEIDAADFPENPVGTGGGLGEWRIEGGARAASPSLLDNRDVVKWFENPADPGDTEDRGLFATAYVEFPADENATNADGMLFMNNSETSSQPSVMTLYPHNDGWVVTARRDNTFDKGFDNQADSDNMNIDQGIWGMVFVDWDTENLIGGYIDADGTVIDGRGEFAVTKLEDGRYDIRIGDPANPKTGDDGMLILQAVGTEPDAPDYPIRAFENYQYADPDFPDADHFSVTLRDWEEDLNVIATEVAVPLKNAAFYFAWVDFTNPMVPPQTDTVCPGDTDGDNLVGLDDLLAVLGNFGNATAGGAADGDVDPAGAPDGIVGLDDLLLVLGNFGNNCD